MCFYDKVIVLLPQNRYNKDRRVNNLILEELMNLTIGEKIKKLRRERDLTQEEVAAHLGISFQAISKWERGVSQT